MKKPLRRLAFLNALILFFCLPLSAQIQVSIPEIPAKPDRFIRVPVNVTSITAYGFRSFGMEVQFDSSMVDTVRTFKAGTLSRDMLAADNVISGNILKVGAAGNAPMVGDGVLIYLYFHIKKNISERIISLHFRDFFFDQGTTSVEKIDGAIIINEAPRITSKPVRKAFVDSLYEYQVEATDEDGDELTYRLLLSPDGMEIDSTTGLITWTPDDDARRINFVRVQASDGYETDEQFYTLVVQKNRPKWWSWILPIGEGFEQLCSFDSKSQARITVNEGLEAGRAISIAHYDTTPPPETMDNLPGFRAITFFSIETELDSGSFDGELEYLYNEDFLREYTILDETDLQFAYLDTMGGDWKLISVQHDTVNNSFRISTKNFYASWAVVSRAVFLGINRKPRLWGTIIGRAVADSLYSMRFAALDVDGDNLTFRLVRNPLGMAINSSSGEITWTPALSDTGLHRVVAAVSDGVESVSREFLIYVFHAPPVNSRKTIDPISKNVEIDLGPTQKKMEIRFGSGDVENKSVEVTIYDQTPPAGVRVRQTPRKAALYLEIASEVMEKTFTASLKIPFSNEQLTQANIRDKRKLTLARFRESDSTWQKVPTEIDTTENIAEALTEEFSIWTLMDEEYFVVSAVTGAEEIFEINTPVNGRLTADTASVAFRFVNNSSLRIYVFDGEISGNTVTVTQYPLSSDPLYSDWLYYYEISSDLSDFTADITFGFSDSLISARGIPEDSLVASYYDSVDSRGFIWRAVPGLIDPVNNTLTVTAGHFSKWVVSSRDADFISDVEAEEAETPEDFRLYQNYPNPFNPLTTIRYDIPGDYEVRLTIYNILGQEIRELVNERQTAGSYSVRWDGTNGMGIQVSSGIYIYRLRAENFTGTGKMLFVR